MGFLGRAGFLLVGFLMAVFVSNKILLSRVSPVGEIRSDGLHVICRGVTANKSVSEAQVLFHHGDYGSAFQFLSVMDMLAAKNISSCSFDRPGYGFSTKASENASCPVSATIHVAHSLGAVYAFSCKKPKKKAIKYLLLEPLLADSVNEDWTAYRIYLARPCDNDYLLTQTGFARFLRALRLWQPWYLQKSACFVSTLITNFLNRYGSQLAEWDLQLLPSHAEKIRRMFLFGDLLSVLKKAPKKLPKLKKKGVVHVLFAESPGEPQVRNGNRRRMKAVLASEYDEQVHFENMSGSNINDLINHPVVLEKIEFLSNK